MTKTYIKYRARITVLSSLILLVWAVLAGRLFQIQVLDGSDYRSRGRRQAQVKEILPADRGTIYDSKNIALTSNLIHYSVGVHPAQVNPEYEIAGRLHTITGKSAAHYRKRLDSDKKFIYLERNLDDPRCEQLLTQNFPGVTVEKQVRRNYPHENIAGQIIGFINVDGAGIAGLELQYDRYLQGEAGWMIKQADGLGKTQRKISLPIQAPIDGADIFLTIDLEYQTLLQEELMRRLEETGSRYASGILMNPQDGSILAMASVPDYNPGNPGQSPLENQKNRVITDQFEPGSTFKLVCATAALDQNIVALDQEFNCEGGAYSFAGKTIQDWEEFGLLNFSQIIEQSSNVGIIKVAERIGATSLYRYSRDYGFGARTNISLMGETGGILRQPQDWSDISLAELSIGYEVGVTALQLACAYSALANGGILMKPRIVDRIISRNGKLIYGDRPEVIRKVADSRVMDQLSNVLTRAVVSGTGTNARLAGWSIAGKTGTAQKFVDGSYSRKDYISNFAGFFPVENPRIVGVFVLDEPNYGYHWGGIGAAPLFRRVVQRIINLDDELQMAAQADQSPPHPQARQSSRLAVNVPPLVLSTAAVVAPDSNGDRPTMPDIRGMSLRKALHTVAELGMKPKFQGSGRVVWQNPKPGDVVRPNSTCAIGLQ